MAYTEDSFDYGPVVVLRGKHKGRIGELDDDTTHRGRLHGIVKFAPPFITAYYHYIPITHLEAPNTQQLMARLEELFSILSPLRGAEATGDVRVTALEEYSYISNLLNDRMFAAQFEKSPRGAKIFLSHSSSDKTFVRSLAVDLSAAGHQPWLDEWQILAGESIVERVGSGLDEADFLVVVLSKAAVSSKWVENEWQTKYWDEANRRHVTIIPILIEECAIPTLLRPKRYVDFRHDYTSGLELLTKSIGTHLARRTEPA